MENPLGIAAVDFSDKIKIKKAGKHE